MHIRRYVRRYHIGTIVDGRRYSLKYDTLPLNNSLCNVKCDVYIYTVIYIDRLTVEAIISNELKVYVDSYGEESVDGRR